MADNDQNMAGLDSALVIFWSYSFSEKHTYIFMSQREKVTINEFRNVKNRSHFRKQESIQSRKYAIIIGLFIFKPYFFGFYGDIRKLESLWDAC